ncbi:MAG: gliding motility-associated C-terminal domain-containing protein [Flavobacteriales bacterium]|nr:gliding motility-associated C-terminal domain-containing protein [Flavobacteriales bacterium]
MKLNLLPFILFILLTSSSFAQPCQLISIETNQKRILPECNDSSGAVFFTNTYGGTTPYTYNLEGSTNQIGVFTDLKIGIYSLIITDARSCADTFTVNLTYRDLEDIIKPDNAFTPNGDAVNDTWYIPGIESFAGSKVHVFNRWGQKVFLNHEYSNDIGWNGKQNGADLPEATYYYVIDIFNNCIQEQLMGAVTIIR